ncbi:MAG: molybdenum cofactor biosynthesis protein MoaE [Planctomycetota bacterium]
MIELIEGPIETGRLLAAISDSRCGAQVMFVGSTRQWTAKGEKVLETERLEYESYREMALKQLQALADKACERWPVKKYAIVHRLGKVMPEEASVAVAVSTPHRSEAFEAAKWLIDTIKHDVPIWKQEHYVQNGAEWIHPSSGNCSCDHKKPVDGEVEVSGSERTQL